MTKKRDFYLATQKNSIFSATAAFLLFITLIFSQISAIRSQQDDTKNSNEDSTSNTVDSCLYLTFNCSNLICNTSGIYCNYDAIINEVPIFMINDLNSMYNASVELQIRFTNITKLLRDSFQNFENSSLISSLDLSYNKISYIQENTFLPLKNSIKKLNLAGNKLLSFQFEAYLALTLDSLILSENTLKNFTFQNSTESAVTKLTSLQLNDNLIEIFPVFNTLFSSLSYLDLSKNKIHIISNNAIKPLQNLETLKLLHLSVSLSCIESGFLNDLTKLKTLYLSSNWNNSVPDYCWFQGLDALNEFLFEFKDSTLNSNAYCDDQTNYCWINFLSNVKNVSVLNPQDLTVCSVNKSSNFSLTCSTNCVNSNKCSSEILNTTIVSTITTSTKISINSTTINTLNAVNTNRSNDTVALILGSVFGVLTVLILLGIGVTLYLYRKKKFTFGKRQKVTQKYFTEDNVAYENEIRRDSLDDGLPSSPSNSDYRTAIASDEDRKSYEESSASEKIGEIVQIREIDEITDIAEMKQRKSSLQDSFGNNDTKSDIDHYSSASNSDMIDIIDTASINMNINEALMSLKEKSTVGVSTNL